MLFGKSQVHRRFSYTPRYSKPDLKDRVKFTRKTLHRPRGGKSIWFYLILAIAFMLVYLYMRSGRLPSTPDRIPVTSQDAVVPDESH